MIGGNEEEFNAIWEVRITVLHFKSLVECAHQLGNTLSSVEFTWTVCPSYVRVINEW